MAYKLDPNLPFLKLSETQQKKYVKLFKEFKLSEALYEIICFGDSDFMEAFIADHFTTCSNVSVGTTGINNSASNINRYLFNAYHELYLKRVVIDDDMKRYLYEKFIETSYSDEGPSADIFLEMPSDSKQAFERIKEFIDTGNSTEANIADTPIKLLDLKEAFELIKTRICKMIEELCRISGNQERRNSFVFICLYLASKVNSLKKIFKKILNLNRFEAAEAYRFFPLEQIQFILSIYAYSYQNIRKEETSLYLCVLTEQTIMQHLKNFLSQLQLFKLDDISTTKPIKSSGKEKKNKNNKGNKKKDSYTNVKNEIEVKAEREVSAANKTIPKSEKTVTDIAEPCNIQTKSSSDDCIENNYPNLIKDFWLVKNIYSLKIINEHIDVILQMKHLNYNEQSPQEEKEMSEIEFLAMQRCLIVIGEFTKCTAESPHLSWDIKDCISTLTGNNVQQLLKKIRNDLSHFNDLKFGQDWHPSFDLSPSFKHIQSDFQKINDSFKFLLGREKYAAIECFAEKLIGCKTVENMHLLYPNFVLDAIIIETGRLSENYKNVSLNFFQKPLQNLMDAAKQSDKTNVREIELIDKLNDSLGCWISNHDIRPIQNKYILISFAAHLRYFQFAKIKHNKASNYNRFVEILEALVSNVNFKSSLNCEEQHLFEENIYNLIQITENPEIKSEAYKLVRLICKDMKNVEGIKSFKPNYNTIHGLKKNFIQFKNEVDDIFRFIRKQLSLEADIHKFNKKVTIEADEFNRISEIFDILYKLRNIKDKTINLKNEIDRVKSLIRNNNSQLDTGSKLINEMIDILSKDNIDYDLCLDKAKRKYKDKNKCKYDSLVREFMNKDNYSVQSKAKLITDFLRCQEEGADSMLNTNSVHKIVEEGYLLVFTNKFDMLKKICDRLVHHFAGCDRTDSRIDFIYKSKLTLAIEMVLHQVLELAHNYGGGDQNVALLTLRPDVLVHCGKSLRNFLAHQDIFYKLFSFETDLVLPGIAKELSTKKPRSWIPRHNYLMRNRLDDFDWCAEKLYFGETSLNIIRLQEIMFKAVEDDDLVKLKRCIELGADLRGTNVYKRTALQLAFDCSSVECFQLMIERYPVIIICQPQMRVSNFTPTLNVTELSDLIKLVGIILKLPTIKEKLKELSTLDKITHLCRFIRKKFDTYGGSNTFDLDKSTEVFNSAFKIVHYIHLMVYLQEVEEIKGFHRLGITMESHLDINGNSAVHWAAALGFDDICQVLLDNNYGLNEDDVKGNSPLDIAILEGKWKTVKFLRSHKAVKYNPRTDPLLLAIVTDENICSEVWESAPFIGTDNSFNIFLFCYALSYSNNDMIGKLLDYLNSLTSIKVVHFFFELSTHLLDSTILKKLIYNFILSLACFFGRKNVVCSILQKVNNIKEITEKFKYTPDEEVCLNNTGFIHRLFQIDSLLHWACLGKSNKNAEVVEFLLSKGYDPNARDTNGFSSLHTALLQGNTQVCAVLIDKGADIELFTSSGLLPIHISSMHGLNEITKIFIEKKVSISELTKQSLRSPLHLAALGGHHQVIKMLLDYNKSLVAERHECIVDLADLNGLTASHLALLQGQKNAANILLDYGADVSKQSHNKMTLIHAAAACSGPEDLLKRIIGRIPEENRKEFINSFTEITNDKEVIKAANILNLIPGIEPKFQGEIGRITMETPLFYAECEEAVRLLLDMGADINLQNSLNRTALHEAIHRGKIDIVKSLLLDKDCIVDTEDCGGYTPLASAAFLGLTDIVILLLKKKANINHRIQKSFSSLFSASKNELVNLVLDKEENSNKNTPKHSFWFSMDCSTGITPIMISASKGYKGVTKILLENKAEIDKDVWQNPLTVAIGNGHSEIAQILLENVFSLEDVSDPKFPYLHFAVAINDHKIVKMLLSKGLSPLNEFNDLSAIEFSVELKHSACYRVFVKHRDIVEHPEKNIYSWLKCTAESSEPKVIKIKDEHNITLNPEGPNHSTYYNNLDSTIPWLAVDF